LIFEKIVGELHFRFAVQLKCGTAVISRSYIAFMIDANF
tara:strand:- start:4 stop:120 length:117 start_codon:yes stop_codon:yes gene_type:complete